MKIIITIIIFMCGVINCNAMSNEKYYKTLYENNNYKTEEITKEGYEAVDISKISTEYIETEYKKVSLNKLGQTVELNVTWKKTPKYKSYGVIAIMSEGATFDANSLDGYQNAILSSRNQSVHYNIATKNTKILSNGIGISMNLIDDAIYYNLSLSIRYTGKGIVYGNYRHATNNVALDQSLKYSLKNGSIVFNTNSLNDIYDVISPISINIG